MTREEIIASLIVASDWKSETLVAHPAFDHFVAQMKERQYGPDPLHSAWTFFAAGWDADPEP